MEITGKVHCFFEQSGVFKNEFKKLGYEAFDYDIQNNFGKSNFIVPPSIVDNDRTLRGDTFKKPTAYWFWGCNPTNGKSYQKKKQVKRIVDCKHDRGGGICSEERSMIHPDYARNFICDFILGKEQDNTLLTLF